MAILFIPGTLNPNTWITALQRLDAHLRIDIWPNVSDISVIQFAVVWKHPPGELLKYPNLKCISSTGAGVDHILNDSARPLNVPIVRIVDRCLVRNMSQYVVWAVLNHARCFDEYAHLQTQASWHPLPFQSLPQIGIMGLGQLGTDVAIKLRDLGFTVSGWSTSSKNMPGISCFSGDAEQAVFLHATDIIICLLPLTSHTRHILNRQTFNQLRKKAYVINVARGDHLIAADLLAALDNDILSGACLDVFSAEPLPSDHPFWRHPKIKITPHSSSVTDPVSAASQIFENYQRAISGQALLNQVDVERGY